MGFDFTKLSEERKLVVTINKNLINHLLRSQWKCIYNAHRYNTIVYRVSQQIRYAKKAIIITTHDNTT